MQRNERGEPERNTTEPDRFLFGAVGAAALTGILVGALIGALGGAVYYAFDDRASIGVLVLAGVLFGGTLGGVFAGTQVAGPFDHK